MNKRNLIFVWVSVATLEDVLISLCRICLQATHCKMDGSCYIGLKEHLPQKCITPKEEEEHFLLYPMAGKDEEDTFRVIEEYKQNSKVRVIVLIDIKTQEISLCYGDLGPVNTENPYLQGIEMLYEIEKGEKIDLSKIKDCRETILV